MKIAITGFYGKGNFGDDVLFKVTYNLVRQYYPEADISAICDRYGDDYLPRLIGRDIRVIEASSGERFDLIVHGGGGTFFDFTHYGWKERGINLAIKLMGYGLYATLITAVRRLLGKELVSAAKRYGFGIGVGTYTPDSAKLKYNIPVLTTFDLLATRDPQSIANLEKLGIDIPVKLGSDLAFLRRLWAPSPLPYRGEREKRKIGLILRDWHKGELRDYLGMLNPLMERLEKEYDTTLFIFDEREDSALIAMSERYSRMIWEPMRVDFAEYCLALADQDILITSRAHGAMCGALLGVASIIIEIEPKLRTIHEMLPNASLLVGSSACTPERIISLIPAALAITPETIGEDTRANTLLMEEITASAFEGMR